MKAVFLPICLLLLVVSGCSQTEDSASEGGTRDRTPQASATASPAATAVGELTLPAAVQQGLVEAQFSGRPPTTSGVQRGYIVSGPSIVLSVRRLVEREVSFVVRPMILRNANQDEQNMVVRGLLGEAEGEQLRTVGGSIVLPDGEWHEYLLDAYCINQAKSPPTEASSLSIDQGSPRAQFALRLIERTRGADASPRVILAAVWAITDNISTEEEEFSTDELSEAASLVSESGLDPALFRLFEDVVREDGPPRPVSFDPEGILPSSFSLLGFNTSAPPFDDAKFRQALAHTVDRERITDFTSLDAQGRGLVLQTAGILPPDAPGYAPDVEGPAYSPDRARQLLRESRYADPASRPAIHLTLSPLGHSSTIAQIAAEAWRDVLGVEVELEAVDLATFVVELTQGKYQAFFASGMPVDYFDLHGFPESLFRTGGATNVTQYSSREVDGLLDQARQASDTDERARLYRQAEQIILRDAPLLPFFFGY